MDDGTYAPPRFVWDGRTSDRPDSPLVEEELPRARFQFDLSAALANQGADIDESSADDDPGEFADCAVVGASHHGRSPTGTARCGLFSTDLPGKDGAELFT